MQNSRADCRGSRAPAPSACRARAPSIRATAPDALQSGPLEPVMSRGHRSVRREATSRATVGIAESENPSPSSSIRLRIASSTANTLCPSFICSTPASSPSPSVRESLHARQQLLDESASARRRHTAARSIRDPPARFRPHSYPAGAGRCAPPSRATPWRKMAPPRVDLHRDRLAVRADRRLHRHLVHVHLQVVFVLPPGASRRWRK